jgi:hypothetical protein
MERTVVLRLAEFFIARRAWVLIIVGLLTGLFLLLATGAQVKTVFDDLLPSRHPYMEVHNAFKGSFGGSNLVSIAVTVEDGDIFRREVLAKIQDIGRDLLMVSGVNEFQIISLASKKLRNVRAGTEGVDTKPIMWPYLPETPEAIEKLRESVLSNRLVYGTYVSRDLKAALITVDFIERQMDYPTVYRELMKVIDRHQGNGITIKVVGEPILQGIINAKLPQTVAIFVSSLGALGLLLFVFFMRSYRGTLIPMLAAVISAIWALGIARLLGMNFDPLGVVIGFLITARVVSHSVQSVNRFDLMISAGMESSTAAGRAVLGQLFKPGILAVITDAGGVLMVALAPIPLLQKTAIIGAIWVSCITVTGVILTPVLLSYVRQPRKYAHPFSIDPVIVGFLKWAARICARPFGRWAIVSVALVVILVCGYFGNKIEIGDANPGTPLLWQDSEYNIAVDEINRTFLGTDRMFVVVRGQEKDTLKDPEVLQGMVRFQRYVERQYEVGGSISLADLVPGVKRVLNEDNPRFEEIGWDRESNAELLYMFLAGSDPGDLDRFSDMKYQNAGITLYFRDHKGATIRTAVSRMKDFIQKNPLGSATIELAGGLVGVLAAVNEVVFRIELQSAALALLVVLVTSGLTYRYGTAGLYFVIPLLLSNTITFTFMHFAGISLNINSLPVTALGIGLGVDYAIYVVDCIKEEFAGSRDIARAVEDGLLGAGRGVVLTATPLVLATTLWYLFSTLRFQAEMAILIAVWMAVSALSALLVMPAVILIVKPGFILANGRSGVSDKTA